jgi:hypothetical protein
MKYLAYQETVENVTYSLYVRIKYDEYIYDIEVKTLTCARYKTKVARDVCTDCQKAFLLIELLIQGRVQFDELVRRKITNKTMDNHPVELVN